MANRDCECGRAEAIGMFTGENEPGLWLCGKCRDEAMAEAKAEGFAPLVLVDAADIEERKAKALVTAIGWTR